MRKKQDADKKGEILAKQSMASIETAAKAQYEADKRADEATRLRVAGSWVGCWALTSCRLQAGFSVLTGCAWQSPGRVPGWLPFSTNMSWLRHGQLRARRLVAAGSSVATWLAQSSSSGAKACDWSAELPSRGTGHRCTSPCVHRGAPSSAADKPTPWTCSLMKNIFRADVNT